MGRAWMSGSLFDLKQRTSSMITDSASERVQSTSGAASANLAAGSLKIYSQLPGHYRYFFKQNKKGIS
jgi:hypothetical protein